MGRKGARNEPRRDPRERERGRAGGGAVASDAFSPFADAVEAAAAVSVMAIIEPGASVRDVELMADAAAGLAMVFIGQRHFRH